MITGPGIVLEQPFVGTQRLRMANKKQGAFLKRRLMLQELRAQTSGTVRTTNETASDTYKEEPKEFQKSATTSGVEGKSKDNQLVFVAGATGKVGSRTVRELLKLGFRVRAGVRSLQKANALLESVRQLKLDSQDAVPSAPVGPTTEQKIEIVECDLEKPDEIGLAISNAGVVVCCIGASEKEVFDVTGPYRIDYQATKNLIDAATVAKVNHFILLTSLGTNKVGFPAALLNLFWGVLIWKRKAEQALINSGLPYTIVRPGGMERPTDAYKETHNLVLASADTYFGGQVSNLQVAELIACMAKNRELCMNNVVEVIAETTALLLPMEELLASLSSANGVSKFSSQEKELTEVVKSASETQSSVEQDLLQSAVSAVPEKAELQMVSEKSRPLSPYTMYEDLKPPTSPCPSTPNLSRSERSVTAAVESPPQNQFSKLPVIAERGAAQKEEVQISHSQSRPLSPYPMYEDLKPPASPSPTLK